MYFGQENMLNFGRKYGLLMGVLVVLFAGVQKASAEQLPYLCELGIQGGMSYYTGDAQPHIFLRPRETYGAQFRYKFTPRWALQVKGQAQRIAYPYPKEGESLKLYHNQVVGVDAVAEFNFFRFGERTYDTRYKPITPYMFLGVGCAFYNGNVLADRPSLKMAAYLPLGIGMKWKFSQHFGLNIAWQHNIYLADNLEGIADYDNTYKLNGSNLLNCDLTGTITLGMVFEFARQKSACRTCQWN